jgi:tetratricopeptide (TPR) repeat protein
MQKKKLFDKAIALVQQGKHSVAAKMLKKNIINPKVEDGWLLLADACMSACMLKETIQCYESAIEVNSDCAIAYSNLGKLFAHQGNKMKALDFTQKSIEAKYNDALIQFNCAYVLHTLERYDAALKHILISIELEPNNAMAHSIAGSCCQAIGDTKKLIYHFEESLRCDPNFVDSLIRLGSHYQSAGDFGLAEKYFEDALSVMPNSPQVMEKMAGFLTIAGKKKEAYVIIRRLIDTHTESSYTLNLYADLCSEYGNINELIELSENYLKQSRVNNNDKRNIGFALGKVYDRKGDYDLAFEKYTMANKAFYANYNVQSYVDYTQSYIDLYNSNYFSHTSINPNVTEKPIFIIGMPRSGTTLTEQLLSQHTKVFAGGELPYLRDVLKEYSGMHDAGNVSLKFLKNINTNIITEMAEEYIHRVNQLSNNSEKVTDKMPSNYFHLGVISQMFPKAKILHCTRDPRDICLSIYFQNFGVMQPYSSNLNNIAHIYLEYERLMRHWTNNLNIDVYEVKYEDLVIDFEEKARGILKYCELEWEDECLEFYNSKRIVATVSSDQVNKPIYNKSVGRWRNYKKYIAEMENILYSAL